MSRPIIPVIFLLIALVPGAQAQTTALERLGTYIEIDTTNPPGNETRGVEFFAAIFEAAGIPYETVESAPGRGNIWVRLKGGSEPGLILLHHIDVVPATPEAWRTDPLKAVEIDGELYGRGTLDTKSLGIMHLEAFLALHRSGQPLNRDVIFMATADEEAGGLYGAGWLVENRPEIFEGVGYLLNEGGRGVISAGGKISFHIELAQKRPYWLRLTATDEPGHGSRPRPTSATTRLIAALQRIQEAPFEPRIVGPVRDMFKAIADDVDPQWREPLKNIDQAILDPRFVANFQAELPGLHALIRNTCSITVLTGSQKINVVSPTAVAELDCRILPDQDSGDFLDGIRARIDDDQIEIEEIMLFGAAATSSDTPLYTHLVDKTREHFPAVGIAPAVATGFTDSHFFRDIGIASYGYSPGLRTETQSASVHGNNERIGIATFNQGVNIMIELVEAFATD
jgi:acetylornithine deacetylase/succinyl-diaminopimelate desuccinylase-like protein